MLGDHPLRRELIATIVSNDVVNSQGVTFVSRLVAETGATPAEVVRAFRIARDVVDAVPRWDAVESLDGKIDPGIQNDLMSGVDRLVESTARWYLVRAPGLRLGEAVDQARAAFRELSSVIEQIGPEAWREQREAEAARLTAEGVPDELARRHAFQDELVHGPDIISVSRATGRPVLEVARGFFLLGERLEIDWLEQRLDEQPAKTRWQRWAVHSMEDDLYTIRREIIETVLEQAGRPADRRGRRRVPRGPERRLRTGAAVHAGARDGGRDGPLPAHGRAPPAPLARVLSAPSAAVEDRGHPHQAARLHDADPDPPERGR